MTRSETPLIVHTDWSRSWGGQEIRTLTELREMREHGFRCALVVPEQSELARRGRAEGFTVCPVEFTSMPGCLFLPGIFDQDASHGRGGDAIEVMRVVEFQALFFCQPQPCFVNQGGGLEGLSGTFIR